MSTLFLILTALAAAPPAADAPDRGRPWARHVIDDSSRGADGVRLADANGDGRPDLVTGWEQGGITRLYLNPGPAAPRDPWPAVTVGRAPDVEDAVIVDLDEDGTIDVISSCEGKTRRLVIHWGPTQPAALLDPQAWRTEVVPASDGMMMWMFCVPLDVDRDGATDLVAGGKGGGARIGWWRAPPDRAKRRDLSAWQWHPLSEAGWVMSIIPADMDGDGDSDLAVSDRKGKLRGCRWLENPGRGRPGDAWPSHAIAEQGGEPKFMTLADVDGDGLTDAVCGSGRRLVVHRRQDAAGRNWQTAAAELPPWLGGFKAAAAGDIDLDGKPDLVVTCEGATGDKSGVAWFSPNADDRRGIRDIAGPAGVKYDLCPLLDLDADGDLDVLTTEEADGLGVVWYENLTRG